MAYDTALAPGAARRTQRDDNQGSLSVRRCTAAGRGWRRPPEWFATPDDGYGKAPSVKCIPEQEKFTGNPLENS